MAELFGLGSIFESERFHQPGATGAGTNSTVQPRCTQAMKETPVRPGAVQKTHGTGITIWQDRLGPVFAGDPLEPLDDRIERFVPGDALESAFAFGSNALLRIQQAIGRVLPVQVLGHLSAQEAARHWMRWISTQMPAFAVIYCNEQRTAVGAVEGANRVSNLGHLHNYTSAIQVHLFFNFWVTI